VSDDLIRRLKSGVATKAQVMGGFTIDIPATQAMLSEAADTLARQQALLDRALEASLDDKARADRAEEEIARLREALADLKDEIYNSAIEFERPTFVEICEGIIRAALTPKP